MSGSSSSLLAGLVDAGADETKRQAARMGGPRLSFHCPPTRPFPLPAHPCPADVAVQPLVFLAIYYSFTLPALPFVQLYGVGVLVVWYCSSWGTLMSLVAPPSSSLIATVAVLMVSWQWGGWQGSDGGWAALPPNMRASRPAALSPSGSR